MRVFPISAALVSAFLLAAATNFSVSASEVPERSEIAEDLKWDLTNFYPSTDSWEADFRQAEREIEQLKAFKGRLTENSETLLSAIQASEAAQSLIYDTWVYAGLKSDEDLRISEHSERFSQARSLITSYNEATAFWEPELMATDPAKLDQMISQTPELNIYRHYFDETLRMREFTLSEAEERILSLAGEPLSKFQQTFNKLDNADIFFGDIVDEDGNTVELTDSRYGSFVFSNNRGVREAAWKGLHQGYEKLGNTLAANYEGHVRSRVFYAKARGFDSALHAATYNSSIPQEVYTNLIKVSREGAGPLQRYLALKREALGLDTLEVWDLYAPITDAVMADIPWEDAKKLVAEALTPLGQEYLDVYWKGFDEGWADVMENKGKQGGAYSWGTYNSDPYFLMSYTGTLSDVATLAHEYGHSMHKYLRNQTQPFVYSGARTFIAEVASMTNEALLYDKLLAEAESNEEKIYILQSRLDDIRGSFYRQTSFADFEMQTHAAIERGDALSKDSLNKIYAGVFNAYYGGAVNVTELNAVEWSRIPHFLRQDNFYVYQYATSYAAATALAKAIRTEGEPARARFLAMLKAGDSDYPIELLMAAGVDMTTPQPIIDTIEEFDRLTGELEAALTARSTGD